MAAHERCDDAFVADRLYGPEVLLFDELLSVDREESRVACRMPTADSLPFTRTQRADPLRHTRHGAGAVLGHATGMLGFVHAYSVMGLRCRDGWVGYGTHIHKAVFRKLAPPGEPIEASCRATKIRSGRQRHLVRYDFVFTQGGEVCYEGDQSAMWMRIASEAEPDR
jgi:hypothetical protein